jgi:hypothetical protein
LCPILKDNSSRKATDERIWFTMPGCATFTRTRRNCYETISLIADWWITTWNRIARDGFTITGTFFFTSISMRSSGKKEAPIIADIRFTMLSRAAGWWYRRVRYHMMPNIT